MYPFFYKSLYTYPIIIFFHVLPNLSLSTYYSNVARQSMLAW